jgi:L-fuconate dehydratase
MPLRITDLHVQDIRFPTSREGHGSDAMNPDPDYSAAYVSLCTDGMHQGQGLVFTLGRGTELCRAAVLALQPFVVGRSLEDIVGDFGDFWREITGDSQLRWLGPEKGIVHMATAALVNAVWDLWSKVEQKPLWQLVSELSPEALVRCIDFRYITDAISPDDALRLLNSHYPTRGERIAQLRRTGYPAYTTSAGWLGYSDQQLRQLCRQALAEGWPAIKVKVGADPQQDQRRLRIVREEIGSDCDLMLDANQVWEVQEAIDQMQALARFDPLWIEEPTSPDDILGHARIAEAIRPIGVASGEMGQNRVLFKQLLQARAIGFCQIDSCRLGGVNEALAVMLLAAKFGVPICPHGGGVGLCEQIQHLSVIDYVCISGQLTQRFTEYVDHLHEHFVQPVVVHQGRYQLPTAPGYSLDMWPDSLQRFRFPDGPVWRRGH